MFRVAALVLLAAVAGGCQSMPDLPPLRTVEHVDLERFMGDWYVIGSIPTFVERGAHNAVESYELQGDRKVATTFTYRKGSFDGNRKTMTPTGFVTDDPSNAVWGMQFVWPVKAEYLIIHLNEDYSQTVIGRNKRDYVWIMARTPAMPDADYRGLVEWLGQQGYDTTRIEKVPQQWP